MTAINDVVDLSRDGEIAVITVNSPPVNALSAPVRDGIAEGVTSAVADPDVKAIVLICAGRTFIAGADITEFGKPPRGTSLHQMIDVIESATKPVIAAIHGTALGGGLETALGAHYRVAVPSAKLGLPEVKLGLLPGAGGTQRLPRVVGAEAALKMVTSGNPIGAKAALDSGLVDELVDEADLRGGAIAFAQKVVAENRPLKKIRDRSVTADPALFAEFRAANARKFRGFDAPEANIKCIEAAVTLPFEEGMKRERELFMGLMTGTQSAAQRHIFFAERQAARIKDLPEGTAPRPIKSVGVIGAGTMGGGISMNFLSAGIPVTIVETSPEALDRGVGIMRKNYAASAAKGALKPEAVEANMGRLTPVLDLEALKDCDLIIEAVFEDMAIKKEIFAKLDRIAKPGAILASNTSYLDVNEIASATSRPQDVVGLHFFSPANVMKLLEVVRGAKTAPDVLATAMSLAKTIGKVAVVAGVCFGFIGNRMLRARQDQAQALILEGAMPWDVDRVLYDFGFPMGPFQMADLAGLDIGWNAATSKGETVRDRLCEAGKRGQKTGSGFYDYDEKRNRTPSKVAEEIILAKSAELGIARRQISDAEILERCLYPMINEGAKILEEGIAQRPSDIDVAWIYGYGFPVYRGGPMFYGDTVGLKAVLEGLEKYEKVHGAAFKPAALLGKLAAEGKSFRDLN
ncbi:3-hydroxyacyl-CoA dehydrogenase NAD-binding domain-containing protein [Sphingosinicella sp.]|uniref:3-hydroxyacyl-CoA dehydrogenase NAD-binding domain-containing protein n=1 Tax=Sphingosinicella sp. TaxID=1917971 RepID=UPI00182AA3F4|nr:3-hydroxyacyl-CoA dehydrogenase NAD-binding domain-containing protein [Sphingosinicella sp.]MBA4758800.1 enoyl-CoA hydratase/isomerase family protein [Sphingosinicella sp.]